jgi:hypothetical protein
MFNNSVSFKDYEGIQGFGIGSQAEVDELNKALSAGYQRPPASGGSALRVESLEATLRTVTFTLQNIKLWPKMPKLPAFSTVEEYNLLQDYGSDAGAFTAEGDLPETQDATYARKTALVKFLGTTREVTHPMTLVKPAHGNVVALETQNGAVWLVERLERAGFFGRSDVNSYEFDGLAKQMFDGAGLTNIWDADPVSAVNPIAVDLRGGVLTEDIVESGTNVVVENYGTATDLFLAPRAGSDMAKNFFPRERVNLPYPTEGKVGIAINSLVTNAGLINFNSDVFLRPGRNNGQKSVPGAATSTKAPAAPSSVTATPAPATTPASKFIAADVGNYRYAVSAINRYGESMATSVAGVTPVAAGDKVTLLITDGAGLNPAATGYKVYRSPVGGGAGTEVIMIPGYPRDTVSPADTVVVDYNFWLPGTSMGFMIQNNLQFYSFRQLAPMLKIPLATVAASIRWMQLLYGTPIVYAPRKGMMFINIRD